MFHMKDLYKKHFAKIFPTLEEALEVEKKALDGDDRAALLLGALYGRVKEISENDYYALNNKPDETVSRHEVYAAAETGLGPPMGWRYSQKVGGKTSEQFFAAAKEAGRDADKGARFHHYLEDSIPHFGSVQIRLDEEAERRHGNPDFLHAQVGYTSSHGVFHSLYYPDVRAAYDKPRYEGGGAHLTGPWGEKNRSGAKQAVARDQIGDDGYQYHIIKKCIEDAKRGIPEAADILAMTCSSPKAHYYSRFMWSRVDHERPNPAHDAEKGKYWTHAAKCLKGKCTPEEKARFISEFWADAKTGDELFDAGYALIHSPFKDFKKGVEFLERSAEAGNGFAARELGEIYEGYDKQYAPEMFAHEPDDQARLQKSYQWYHKAGKMGAPNGTARCTYLLKRHPQIDMGQASSSVSAAAAKEPPSAEQDLPAWLDFLDKQRTPSGDIGKGSR